MEIYWVYNNRILNSTPFENSLPLIGSEFIWVDFNNSLFDNKYHNLLSNNLWKVTNIRYASGTSIEQECIVFIVLDIVENIKNIQNYTL